MCDGEGRAPFRKRFQALRHRVKLTYEAIMRGVTPDQVIAALVNEARADLRGGKRAAKTEESGRLFRRS